METILITGGTGLVGRTLVPLLQTQGYHVIVAGRKPAAGALPGGAAYVQWDVNAAVINPEVMGDVDYIIHLAGAGVMDKKWTADYRRTIQESRTKSSALITRTLAQVPNRVKAVVSASAIGWYGADKNPPVPFTENDPADAGFLGETCRLWEESIAGTEALGKRLVRLRIGIVLSRDGGALAEFIKPLRFGISGILGGGRQVISWIHIEDLCRMFLFAITNEDCRGIYNAVAPSPVPSRRFMQLLAGAMRKWFIPVPVPAFALKLMLGERSIEILKSTTVSCAKIAAAGFVFTYPDTQRALEQLSQ